MRMVARHFVVFDFAKWRRLRALELQLERERALQALDQEKHATKQTDKARIAPVEEAAAPEASNEMKNHASSPRGQGGARRASIGLKRVLALGSQASQLTARKALTNKRIA